MSSCTTGPCGCWRVRGCAIGARKALDGKSLTQGDPRYGRAHQRGHESNDQAGDDAGDLLRAEWQHAQRGVAVREDRDLGALRDDEQGFQRRRKARRDHSALRLNGRRSRVENDDGGIDGKAR